MPNRNQISDTDRHLAALDYLRQAKTRDAAPDDGESHIHIHLDGPSGGGQGLPRSVGNSNPVINDESDPEPEPEPTEEGEESERVLGELPPPPPGQKYALRDDGGTTSILLVPDDGGDVLSRVNVGDRAWSDRKAARVLSSMNKANRAAHTRDAKARREQTVFTHFPLPSERLVVRENPKYPGKWEVILISDTTNLIGTIPPGAEDLNDDGKSDADFPDEGQVASPGEGQRRMNRIGDRAAAMTIKQLNETNRAYWAARKAG